MPDAALDATSRILGRSLITAEALYQDMRERLVKELAKTVKRRTFQEVLGIARKILSEFEPIMAEHLSQADLAAWLAGFKFTSDQFPFWLDREFSLANEEPPKPPSKQIAWQRGDEEPLVRFPLLGKAAESLEQRGILTRAQFDLADTQAKQRAFTIAGEHTTDTLTIIRDALATDIKEGTSLRGFEEKFSDIFETSPIGPAQLETVYRTNVQAAFRDGRETLLSDPIVNEVFPYQAYTAVHDARVTPEHLALETLGLDGTSIYRRDDAAMWDRFTPPWNFNCRCGIILMTIADAARAGVREAKEWLAGTPPITPEWRGQYIPFPPNPGFGSRGRVVRAA